MSTERRVVITGMGCVSPLGLDLPATWAGIVAGRSGVGPITRFDASGYETTFAAEATGFDPEAVMDRKEARRMDRHVQLGIAALLEARRQACLTESDVGPDRVGLIIGSGMGSLETMESGVETLLTSGPKRIGPFFTAMSLPNMASGMAAIAVGAKGPCYGTVSACDRDGFVLGEGGAVLVLEELEHALARGAEPLAELLGYGATDDANHMVQPAPEGEGVARAMQRALRSASLRPEQIGYLNAHATSTKIGERNETRGIKTAFGEHAAHLPVSSTKSMTGHLLGAAGSLEAIFCVQALREGILPPTINYETPDPECDLDYVPNTARPASIAAAMSNSLGFGGHNVSLIVGRYSR